MSRPSDGCRGTLETWEEGGPGEVGRGVSRYDRNSEGPFGRRAKVFRAFFSCAYTDK